MVIGLDIARFGTDKTVFVVRHGRRVIDIVDYRGYDLMHTVAVAKRLIEAYNPESLFLDDNGLGGGVTDRLNELGYKCIVPVIAQQSPDDPKKYKNKKQAFLFVSDNIDVSQFENFDIDSWVNTACKGISVDKTSVINRDELPKL